jgi:PAS domain S-box-containing protein
VERRLREESGLAVACQALDWDGTAPLDTIPSGLLVVWDGGGPLEPVVARCRRLHAKRSLARTHLVVLTGRAPQEARALAEAGADECLTPPGEHWGARWAALGRRQQAERNAWLMEQRAEAQRVHPEQALAELLASASSELGAGFFRSLLTHVTRAFRVTCAFVGELTPKGDGLSALAVRFHGEFLEAGTFPLRGMLGGDTLAAGLRHYPDGVRERFPEDAMLQQAGMRGYLGIALRDSAGEPIGLLALLHERPLPAGPFDYALLEAFAARGGAELQRLRAQADLERTRDFLRNAIDAVPDPLFVKDRAHRWVVFNSAFCRLMGRPPEALQGKSDYDFVPAAEADVFWRQDELAFTTGQPNENEESHTGADGYTRTLVTRKAVFQGAGGESYLVATIRDVTERKRLEMQLRLADRMASVGTLAAGVAHEINNPLAYVSSNVSYLREQLARGSFSPEDLADLREAAAEALEGTGRVRTIVQDLRTFSRSDEEHLGPVEVHPVLEGALRLVRNELRHRARLVRELEPVPTILGSAVRLGQVLVNLLVNALQSFPERPATDNRIRLSTRALEQPGWVAVEVEDNGSGMSPEVQRRIFDPFFTTKPGVGTGLGLAICHTIVEAMGGRIEVRSAPGEGSTFRLLLPVFREDAVEAPSPRGRGLG